MLSRLCQSPERRTNEYARFSSLMLKHPSDKWTAHSYGKHYFRHFHDRQHESLRILEIGVGGYAGPHVGYSDPLQGGHSLRFWKEFFPHAQVIGVDIEDKSPLQEDRIRILRGSQTDEAFLETLNRDFGPFDIVIDDGSHVNSHVIQTFQYLFPRLADSGIYVVEDTQTSYWPDTHRHQYGGDGDDLNNPKTIMGFFKSLVDGLNHAEFLRPDYNPTFFDRSIAGISFYHNLVFVERGNNTRHSNMVKNGRINA